MRSDEDGHGDQCTHCTDGYTVPPKSVLMSCEAKPKGKSPIAGGDQSLRGAAHRAKSRGEEENLDGILEEFDGIPGVDRSFTPEEADELYEDVRKEVKSEEIDRFKGIVDATVLNFFGLNGETGEELNVMPGGPEFYDVETTLGTGASTHAADRVDFPGYEVEEPPGSRAGQLFGCAGGNR